MEKMEKILSKFSNKFEICINSVILSIKYTYYYLFNRGYVEYIEYPEGYGIVFKRGQYDKEKYSKNKHKKTYSNLSKIRGEYFKIKGEVKNSFIFVIFSILLVYLIIHIPTFVNLFK